MSFETETYGRYEIKSGPLDGSWGANAYRRKQLIAKATGKSRDEALAAVKAELDRLETIQLSESDEEGAPAAQVYEQAFTALLPTMPDSYHAMLRAHLNAPDHLISATKLAEAAGYSGYEGANLHYGKLGYAIAEDIGFAPPKRDDGSAIWTCAIARDPSADIEFPDTTFVEALMRNFETAHFEWQMRPQVVAALRALNF
jgi:hypothetical protein